MITARTRLYALIGDPVEKSLSPVMHNGWIADHGLDAVYVALRTPDADALGALRGLGIAGVNVTVPHKEAAFRLANRACPTAAALQAANVLRFDADGVSAFNTDAPGFTLALDARWPDWRQAGARALMIGAGGAARAVAHALMQAGFEVVMINRTEAKAQALADALNAQFSDGVRARSAPLHRFAEHRAGAAMIVNTVSDETAIDWDLSGASARCVDLRYGAMQRRFLVAAEQAGLETMDGLGMLIHQGALAFQHWFDATPDIQAAEARLRASAG